MTSAKTSVKRTPSALYAAHRRFPSSHVATARLANAAPRHTKAHHPASRRIGPLTGARSFERGEENLYGFRLGSRRMRWGSAAVACASLLAFLLPTILAPGYALEQDAIVVAQTDGG